MVVSGCTEQTMKYLSLLSQQFPNQQAVFTEIINLHEKIELVRSEHKDPPTWYKTMLDQLITVARKLSSRYTRSKVRKAIPHYHERIID